MKTQTLFLTALVLLTGCKQQFEETRPIRQDITETVFASGRLEAEGMYHLIAKSDGYLVELHFEVGDVVSKDAVLAVIENEESKLNSRSSQELLDIAEYNRHQQAPALTQARKSIEMAQQQLEQDSLLAGRYKALWEMNSVARVEYEQAQLAYTTSRKNLDSAIEAYNQRQQEAEQQFINSRVQYELSSEALRQVQVRAVVEGRVYEKYKEKGDYVSRGTVLARIGHPTAIYAEVNIDESTIREIAPGQQAVVQLNTHTDELLQAVVSEIEPRFDETNQSFTARLVFKEPLEFNFVGTQLQSNIITNEVNDALVIPRKYLDFDGYVQLKDTGERIKVRTKTVSSEWVHVLEGINEESVLTVALN